MPSGQAACATLLHHCFQLVDKLYRQAMTLHRAGRGKEKHAAADEAAGGAAGSAAAEEAVGSSEEVVGASEAAVAAES